MVRQRPPRRLRRAAGDARDAAPRAARRPGREGVLSPGPAEELARRLDLGPHPEGGWYRRTWEHDTTDGAGRRAGSSILYLLPGGPPSRWHRIDAVEVWVHADGAPLELETWAEAGRSAPAAVTLGPVATQGCRPQAVVDPGVWQRATSRGPWSLLVCVVVPEFRFDAFELAADGWEPPTR